MPFLKNLGVEFAVEIGSGSGVVITALASFLACACFATDINPEACQATAETAVLNGRKVDCVNMDLLGAFRNRLFDVLLFNPPYVVTDPCEVVGNGLNRAWAGGFHGRQVTDKVLSTLDLLLSEKGVCYMVLLKENNIQEIQRFMNENNFKSDVILERKLRGEHLYVVKFSRIL
ncbi:hypothetical protein Zmor_020373 [Zophobas morio]|uniref:Methyltransferase HEMK2 n=2 Tax=Zophobas morio TaxID=2755281 RepID=A0AA38I325_9CUCU|nr:hypothetical protein Zmor_020373 [Zophobas morio]